MGALAQPSQTLLPSTVLRATKGRIRPPHRSHVLTRHLLTPYEAQGTACQDPPERTLASASTQVPPSSTYGVAGTHSPLART